MSEDNQADLTCCCASCGVTEIDDIKLVPCDACYLVRYCSDACREEHISQHEERCKKRAAELRDELLFKQPESTHLGDCPICSLPMLDIEKSSLMACCSKEICCGCLLANGRREMEMRLAFKCPFCRKAWQETEEERDQRLMKRIEANDPVAMRFVGGEQYYKGDYQSAINYYTKAADLGDAEAHYNLALIYLQGKGVEKDEEKEILHLEEAAIGGHPMARYSIGSYEYRHDNVERAVKHWIIAATQGEEKSMKLLMKSFKEGHLEKEVLAAALRAHKAAVDATKSPQRKVAGGSWR